MSAAEFRLTDQHVKLLSSAYVEWNDCETGAPAINPKRPYGNSGVAEDVAEILDIKVPVCPHCGESIAEDGGRASHRRMLEIHRETERALAVALSAKSFEPGLYRFTATTTARAGAEWKRVSA